MISNPTDKLRINIKRRKKHLQFLSKMALMAKTRGETVLWLMTVWGIFGHSKAADHSISITLVPRDYIPLREREDFICGFDAAKDSFLGEQNGPFIFGYLDNTESQPKGYKTEVFDVLVITNDGEAKTMVDDLPCTIDKELPGLYSLFVAPNNVQCNSRTFSDIDEAKDGYYPVFIGVSRDFTEEISKFVSTVDDFKQFYKERQPKLCGIRLPVNKETAVSKARVLTGMFNILYNGDKRNFDPSDEKDCRSKDETIDAMKKTKLIDTTKKLGFEEHKATVVESVGFASITIIREAATEKMVGFVKTVFLASSGQINAADERDIVSYEGPILFEINQQSTSLFITIKQDEDDSEEDEEVLIQLDQALVRRKRQMKKIVHIWFRDFRLKIKDLLCGKRGTKSDECQPIMATNVGKSCSKDKECDNFQRCLNKDGNPKNGKVCTSVDRCTNNEQCFKQVYTEVDSKSDCIHLCSKFKPCNMAATKEENSNFFQNNECSLYNKDLTQQQCKLDNKCGPCQSNDGCTHLTRHPACYEGKCSECNGKVDDECTENPLTPACYEGECSECNGEGDDECTENPLNRACYEGKCSECNAEGQAQCLNGLFCNHKVDQTCVVCRNDDDCNMPNIPNCVKNNCVECRNTGDCQDGLKCSDQNRCVECKKLADCDGELKCNVNGQCVDCLRNTHCITAEMPFCNTATNTCEAGCGQIVENVDNCQTRFKQKPNCNDDGQCVACTQGGPNPPNNCPTVDGQNYDVCLNNICGYMVRCNGFLYTNAAGVAGLLKGPEVELIIRGRTSHHHTTYVGVANQQPYADFRLQTYSLPWLGFNNPGNARHKDASEDPRFQDLYEECQRTVEQNPAYSWNYIANNNWFFSNKGVDFNYFGAIPTGYLP